MVLKLLPYQNLAAARFGRERNCSDSNLASVDNHEWPPYCKEAKWHGTQTTGGTGTIFEGKWNCTMLKQSLFQGFRVAGLKREHYVVFKPDFFDVSMDFRFGKVWSCRVLKRQNEPQRCKEAKLHDAQTSRPISHLEHLLRKMQDYRALKPALTQITF